MTPLTTNRLYTTLLFISIVFLFASCYSVRLISTNGAPMPDQNERDDFYRDKKVIVLDTVIKANIAIDDITIPVKRLGCETGKLFSVEYKDTFGGNLLYLITFGSKRKVKIKYVCMKPEN
ncbi:hypothetical protein [Aquimarina sp. 2304DJ70-9]|uniref:hypothetical protein n=1 Tax=Aquimarina penaris TaxID=3231044 RepID=UPI00346197FF